MRARVVITTDEGLTFQGVAELDRILDAEATVDQSSQGTAANVSSSLNADFGLPVRPFMKRYGAGMSGAKRFGLLVARLANGRTGMTVQRTEVEKLWNKMKPLMGGEFNGAYASRAKENGWVDSPKAGQYALLSGWRELLAGEAAVA